MNDGDLAALEHANMIEVMTGGARSAPGGLVRRAQGVAVLASGLPINLFNQVIVEDASVGHERVSAAIAAGVATMRERGDVFMVNLRRGTDDAFLPLMVDLGLAAASGPDPSDVAELAGLPGMALHPIPLSAPGTRESDRGDGALNIRLVVDQAGMEDHLRTCALGFGMPEEMLRAFVADDVWRQPGRFVYVGYLDGEAVVTGLGARTGDTIGIYNISTIESARKHGYGEAMTRRVAADGRAAGCTVAILQASPMGMPLYERLGYRTVVEYVAYTEPAGEPTGP